MPTKRDRYSRQAILMLPRQNAVDIVWKLSGYVAAAAYLQQYAPHDTASLRSLLTRGSYPYGEEEWNETVCHSLVKMHNLSLVDVFFKQIADYFYEGGCVKITSAVVILVHGFGWKTIEPRFLTRFWCACRNDDEVLEALVHLASALRGHDDQKHVLESLLNEAKYWNPWIISEYCEIVQLWNCANHCGDSKMFDRFVGLLKRSGPSSYQSIIDRLAKYSDEVGVSPRERDVFSDLVTARVQYLKVAVANRGNPGVWNIPEACVPGDPEIEEFLRGPQQSKEVTGFPDKMAARAFMSKFIDENCTSMFSMECRGYQDTVVTLTKFSHKHEACAEFALFLDEQLVKLMEKYYPDEDRSWIRETWAKRAPEWTRRNKTN